MTATGLFRITAVCLGNICRSPMAEAVIRARVEDAGLGALVLGKPKHILAELWLQLRQVLSRALVGERAVLLGNAAQTIHPLGAQGFNLGLRDALTLAELLETDGDAGADPLLHAYAARREEDRAQTISFSGGLARLTSNDAPLLRPLRSLGLLAAQATSLQSMLVGGSMGFRGEVPKLCRGEAA